MIIGLTGLAGSGKSTVADYINKKHNFWKTSFAAVLKDSVSVLFSWDRSMLEGDTEESRNWREIKNDWWSEKLGRDVTPRSILQEYGTEIIRNNLHQEFWIYALERKILNYLNSPLDRGVVISDVRFPNEVKFIQDHGGYVVEIQRSPIPTWYEELKKNPDDNVWRKYVSTHIHYSECALPLDKSIIMNYIITNNGSIEDLKKKTEDILQAITYKNSRK